MELQRPDIMANATFDESDSSSKMPKFSSALLDMAEDVGWDAMQWFKTELRKTACNGIRDPCKKIVNSRKPPC